MKQLRQLAQKAFEKGLARRLRNRPPGGLRAQDIREGVPFGRLQALADDLGLTQEVLTRVLGMSARTLQRRRKSGRLSAAESDRFGRLERLYQKALAAFDGDEEGACCWLTTPKRAFRGETPVEHLDTEPGARAAEEMLIVIDQTIPA